LWEQSTWARRLAFRFAGAEIPMGSAKLTADVCYVFLNYDFQQVPELSGLHSDFFKVTFGILFGI
jgi:hypothetical protein